MAPNTNSSSEADFTLAHSTNAICYGSCLGDPQIASFTATQIQHAPMSCGNSKGAATIYVLTPPQKASQFTQDLAGIAKRHGLSADLGRSTGNSGHVYWVVEASGRGLWLWGTNEPLDPYVNPARCGHYTEGHPDPGQYIVMIDHGLGRFGLNHALAMIVPGGPHTLMLEISSELKASGYDVRQSPVECSPLSKEQADAERH